jgi:hypothetical protein
LPDSWVKTKHHLVRVKNIIVRFSSIIISADFFFLV